MGERALLPSGIDLTLISSSLLDLPPISRTSCAVVRKKGISIIKQVHVAKASYKQIGGAKGGCAILKASVQDGSRGSYSRRCPRRFSQCVHL